MRIEQTNIRSIPGGAGSLHALPASPEVTEVLSAAARRENLPTFAACGLLFQVGNLTVAFCASTLPLSLVNV
jgi:hypothetical protein